MADMDELRAGLYEAELEAKHNKWVAGYLKDLIWPASVWTRECLISVDEAEGGDLPKHIQAEINQVRALDR